MHHEILEDDLVVLTSSLWVDACHHSLLQLTDSLKPSLFVPIHKFFHPLHVHAVPLLQIVVLRNFLHNLTEFGDVKILAFSLFQLGSRVGLQELLEVLGHSG